MGKNNKGAGNAFSGGAPNQPKHEVIKEQEQEQENSTDLVTEGDALSPPGFVTETNSSAAGSVENPEPEPEPQPEPEPVQDTEETVSGVTLAVREALKTFVRYHTGDVVGSAQGAEKSATSLNRAYVLALTAGAESKGLMLEIMAEMESNKQAFNSTTMYQAPPSTSRDFYMAMTQWLYEVTRDKPKLWGRAMGDIGHGATQRIISTTPNPKVAKGLEDFLNSMYES